MIPKTSSEIRRKSGKSCPGQRFPRFGPPKRLESWKKLARTTFSTFPRISEEVLFFTKMVEKVGLDNLFHHFYDSKDFLRNSWKKVEKVGLAYVFHDLGLQNGLSRGKSWPGQLFPLFPRISEEVLFFTKMVEKVGLDNLFHHFYDSKDFLRNSWKK